MNRAVIVIGIAILLGACSAPPSPSPPPTAVALPSGPLAGLRVVPDRVSTSLVSVARSELDGFAIATLQDGTVTEGTLEVGHLRSNVNLARPAIENTIAAQATGGPPAVLRVGGDLVYSGLSLSRWVVVWIHGRDLIVLTVRSQFARSRSLLRAALGSVA